MGVEVLETLMSRSDGDHMAAASSVVFRGCFCLESALWLESEISEEREGGPWL